MIEFEREDAHLVDADDFVFEELLHEKTLCAVGLVLAEYVRTDYHLCFVLL